MAAAARKSSSRKGATGSPDLVRKAPAPEEFDKDQEFRAYRDMLMIRRFEEKAGSYDKAKVFKHESFDY